MLRHVVLMQLNDDATTERIADLVDGLRALPAAIAEIRRYEVGADLGLRDGNFDLAIVAEFDDDSAFRAYVAHPAHMAVLEERVLPTVAQRFAVQHRLD